MDPDVSKLLWSNAITIRVTLCNSEVVALEQPPELFFNVPRHGFLHQIVGEAYSLLQHVLPPGENTAWFEYRNLPLKWNVPAGVLHDLLVPEPGIWPLTLHFRNFPSKTLPTYTSEQNLQDSFFNALKEAVFIVRGTAEPVVKMASGAYDDLWRSVLAADYTHYTEIIQSLLLTSTSSSSGGNNNNNSGGGGVSSPTASGASGSSTETASPPTTFESNNNGSSGSNIRQAYMNVPIRVFIRQGQRTDYLSSYQGIEYTSRPAAITKTTIQQPQDTSTTGSGSTSNNNKQDTTLLEALIPILQGFFPTNSSSTTNTSTNSTEIDTSVLALWAGRVRSVYVGGTQPALNTPLQWLHQHMHAPDYFLYIVVFI